jgi:hypothetical protein
MTDKDSVQQFDYYADDDDYDDETTLREFRECAEEFFYELLNELGPAFFDLELVDEEGDPELVEED